MTDQHIIELEHKIAELEHEYSAVSQELYAANQRISELETKVDLMMNAVRDLRHLADSGETPIDRPPHY